MSRACRVGVAAVVALTLWPGPGRAAVCTAYCDRGVCADGRAAGPGRVAGPRGVPLGTRVYIPGYGAARVADRTARRFNGRWDVWLPGRAACRAWGRRGVAVVILSGKRGG